MKPLQSCAMHNPILIAIPRRDSNGPESSKLPIMSAVRMASVALKLHLTHQKTHSTGSNKTKTHQKRFAMRRSEVSVRTDIEKRIEVDLRGRSRRTGNPKDEKSI